MLRNVFQWFEEHPRWGTWIVLAAGMVAILWVAAQGQDFTAGQVFGLTMACIFLAGLCTWIIG